MTTQNNQTDDDQQKKQQVVTARTIGPEGTLQNVEVSAPSESGNELLAPLEGARERRESEQKERERQPKKEDKKIQNQKTAKKGARSLKTPKVYGYRIPPKIVQNLKYLPSLSKKADPKTGFGALCIFLDRLFRMKGA